MTKFAFIRFALYSAEGKLFEILDKDMNILAASTVQEMGNPFAPA